VSSGGSSSSTAIRHYACSDRRTAWRPAGRPSRRSHSRGHCPRIWGAKQGVRRATVAGQSVVVRDLGLPVSRRSKRSGSQEWEPTPSAVLRPTATRSECSCRSWAPGSTQSDGARRPGTTLGFPDTEEVTGSIQYGPRHFSKTCLPLGAPKGSQPPAVLLLNRWSEHSHVTV